MNTPPNSNAPSKTHEGTSVINSYGQAPAMLRPDSAEFLVPDAAEKLLENWFDAPVVLLSAGRTGFHLLLRHFGSNTNRTRVTVPRFTSRCVLSTLVLDALPVLEPGGQAVVHYPQYGFRQAVAPREELVIEDIAHAFFSSRSSGARNWRGVAAVFSLPKFFSTTGLIGGLVVPDRELARALRAERDAMPCGGGDIITLRRAAVIESYKDLSNASNFALLEGAYALYPVFPHADPVSLQGVPVTCSGMMRIGDARAERMDLLSSRLGDPHDLIRHAEGGLPFLFPAFVSPERYPQQVAVLNEMGIAANVYHFDVARNAYEPRFAQAVMVPCHHQIPIDVLDRACDEILNRGP
jgi:hypothetical protein